ncbi:MAG TPA: hypothetical protein VNQ73_06595 [Ilumatobacter sp.]|nr:hypothetical protein [Ilumatobacter sp.]
MNGPLGLHDVIARLHSLGTHSDAALEVWSSAGIDDRATAVFAAETAPLWAAGPAVVAAAIGACDRRGVEAGLVAARRSMSSNAARHVRWWAAGAAMRAAFGDGFDSREVCECADLALEAATSSPPVRVLEAGLLADQPTGPAHVALWASLGVLHARRLAIVHAVAVASGLTPCEGAELARAAGTTSLTSGCNRCDAPESLAALGLADSRGELTGEGLERCARLDRILLDAERWAWDAFGAQRTEALRDRLIALWSGAASEAIPQPSLVTVDR